jgi:hypothetical protein
VDRRARGRFEAFVSAVPDVEAAHAREKFAAFRCGPPLRASCYPAQRGRQEAAIARRASLPYRAPLFRRTSTISAFAGSDSGYRTLPHRPRGGRGGRDRYRGRRRRLPRTGRAPARWRPRRPQAPSRHPSIRPLTRPGPGRRSRSGYGRRRCARIHSPPSVAPTGVALESRR